MYLRGMAKNDSWKRYAGRTADQHTFDVKLGLEWNAEYKRSQVCCTDDKIHRSLVILHTNS